MPTVLVIDDEEAILKHFRELLPLLKCDVMTASTGREGVEKAKNPCVDMIISDLCMPGDLVELELIKTLKATRPDVPIVVISGYPSGEFLAECETLGVADFLTKPFELSFIASTVSKLLTRPEGPGT